MRRLLLAAPLLALASTTAACSAGTAVDADGTTIGSDRVDDVTLAYCAAVGKAGIGQFPLGLVRDQVVEQLTARALATDFAAEHGVTSSADYNAAVSSLRSQLSGYSKESQDAIVDVEGAPTYGGALLLEVGRKLQPGAADAAAAAAAQDAFTAWLEKRDVEVNPVYGLSLDALTFTLAPGQSGGYQLAASNDASAVVDPSVSVAVSSTAKDAVRSMKTSATDSGAAGALPQSQRCG